MVKLYFKLSRRRRRKANARGGGGGCPGQTWWGRSRRQVGELNPISIANDPRLTFGNNRLMPQTSPKRPKKKSADKYCVSKAFGVHLRFTSVGSKKKILIGKCHLIREMSGFVQV